MVNQAWNECREHVALRDQGRQGRLKRAKKTIKQAPRNPLVAVVKFRKAGVHRKTGKAVRRKEKMQTGKLPLDRLHTEP